MVPDIQLMGLTRREAHWNHCLYQPDLATCIHDWLPGVSRLHAHVLLCSRPVDSSDYRSQYNVARVEIGKWVKEKSIKRQFHVLEGIESCSQALPLLFSGANTGKLYVFIHHLLWVCSTLTSAFMPKIHRVVKLAEPDSVAKL